MFMLHAKLPLNPSVYIIGNNIVCWDFDTVKIASVRDSDFTK